MISTTCFLLLFFHLSGSSFSSQASLSFPSSLRFNLSVDFSSLWFFIFQKNILFYLPRPRRPRRLNDVKTPGLCFCDFGKVEPEEERKKVRGRGFCYFGYGVIRYSHYALSCIGSCSSLITYLRAGLLLFWSRIQVPWSVRRGNLS